MTEERNVSPTNALVRDVVAELALLKARGSGVRDAQR